MITYTRLKQTPDIFKNLTGLSVSDFDTLHQALAPVWQAREQERLGQSDRQRAVGGGRNYALRLKEQLLMTLVWLRLSLTTQALGCLFSVGKSTASRNTRRVYRALQALAQPGLTLAEPPGRGQGQNLAQTLQAYPELLDFVDVPTRQRHDLDSAQPEAAAPLADPVRRIGQTPPFQNLPPAVLKAIHRAAHVRRTERHAFLFHQGDPASFFYILLEGQVRLSEVTPDGQQVLVRFVGHDEAIGLIAALTDSVYPLSAQALDDCLTLVWDSASLERLMEQYPRLAINGLRLVAQRWYEIEQRYRELATERVERRVAQTLLRLMGQVGLKVEQGILIDLPLSRQDLAEMTATTLYTVSRILSRWEQDRLVETGRERIIIRDPAGLARIAEDLPPNNPLP